MPRRCAQARPQGGGMNFDLCCGIGGDALALADVGAVTAVDLSAVRGACVRFNVMEQTERPRFPLDVRVADVGAMIDEIPAGALVHIDPARRVSTVRGKKRSADFADAIPGPEVIERIFGRVGSGGGGAIKLSSATDFEELPEGHLELISENGVVVQAVLWRGVLAGDSRTRSVTILEEGQAPFFFTAAPVGVAFEPVAAIVSELKRAEPGALPVGQPFTLYEVDGALTRAGLAGPLATELGFAAAYA